MGILKEDYLYDRMQDGFGLDVDYDVQDEDAAQALWLADQLELFAAQKYVDLEDCINYLRKMQSI